MQGRRLRKGRLAALLVVLCLGCTTAHPPPPSDVLDVPQSWSVPAATGEAAPLSDQWWQSFGDARLNGLIPEGLSHNYDLMAAASRVESALAQTRIVGAELFPELNAGLSGDRSKRNFIGFPIPDLTDQVLSTTATIQILSLDVSWEADLWGRIRSRHRAAISELGATQAEFQATRLSLAAQIARAWFGVLEGARQVDLAERTLESRRLTRELSEARYQRGLTSSLDLRLSRTEVSLAEAAVQEGQRRLDVLRRQLEVLLGRYPSAELEASNELPRVPPRVPPGLPAELLRRRPDLQAAELRAAAAGAQVQEARRALYPRLRLTGSSGTSSNQLKDLVDGDFSIWSLAGGLLQPLFQGGRLRSAVEVARSGENEALATYVARALRAFAEVESALTAEHRLDLRVEALEAAVLQSGAALELAQERYSSGLEGYLAVLASQRQAFQSESQLLDARRQQLTTRVDLILALGGGFPDAGGKVIAAGPDPGD